MKTKNPTARVRKFPTRHGDWRMVDGELIDMRERPKSPALAAPAGTTPADASANASDKGAKIRSQKE